MGEQIVRGIGAGSGIGEWTEDLVLTDIGESQPLYVFKQDGSGLKFGIPYPKSVAAAVSNGGSLTAATTYFYVVSALNQNGETTAPLEVSGLTTSANKTITVSWTAVPGALSYNVYRATSSGGYGASSLLGNILAGTTQLVDNGSTYSVSSGQPLATSTAYVVKSASFPANELGRLYSNVVAGGVATGSGTSPQILGTVTLPAGVLASTGQGVKIRAWGTTASNTNAKTMALTFGATTVATCNGTTSGANWQLEAEVYRNAATTQVSRGLAHYNATPSQTLATPGETLSGAIAVTFTATDGTDSSGDITMNGFVVELVA